MKRTNVNLAKLYKKRMNTLWYWETWELTDRLAIVHYGMCGEYGLYKKIGSGVFVNFRKKIRKEIEKMKNEGYAEMPENKLHLLEVVYTIDGFGDKGDILKRHALESTLDSFLGWSGLGHVDGGGMGNNSMEIACLVVDFETAKKKIEEKLKDSDFSDYTCIRRVK